MSESSISVVKMIKTMKIASAPWWLWPYLWWQLRILKRQADITIKQDKA